MIDFLYSVLEYTSLPAEAAGITSKDPTPSWPEQGAIKFTAVDLRYRPGLPLVLKDVSFEVRAGEKVRFLSYVHPPCWFYISLRLV